MRNTLADTPSGYIQDPRASPKTMTRYDSVSRVGAAALEAMEREKALLEREEVAYRGYTTLTIQERKKVVLGQASTLEELQEAVEGLRDDLAELSRVVGQEVDKPILQERILLLKLQQRQQRLHDRDMAFRVAPEASPGYRLVQQADGSEVLERPGKDTPQLEIDAADDAYLTQPVEMEVLPDSALVPERTVVTVQDVNHVRYLLGQGLRRLSRFEEAQEMMYSILADDVTNVDAIESLLEMDLGIEGWEPRIRVLLDYLVTEYARAIEEGRLQPPVQPQQSNTEKDSKANDDGEEEEVSASSPLAAASPTPERSNATAFASSPDTAALPTSESSLLRTSPVSGVPYATIPQTAPLNVALSLLSDIIVEAAAHKCSADGEGATSRFFIESLGPIVRVLGRRYAPLLLEALFQAVDEQHFMARFDSDDVSPAARAFALSLVIAFLKALTARRIHEMLPSPVLFEYVTLSKLHAALRRANRLHESYHICDKVMRLYRSNSAVYRRRRRSLDAAAEAGAVALDLSALQQRLGPSPSLHRGSPQEDDQQQVPSSTEEEGKSKEPAAHSSEPLNNVISVDSSGGGLTADGEASAEPPDVLDDQDGDYREIFFQYVNDRARDSPALGRRLCLEAMQEFPKSAAPWETLALLLHREDPVKNLRDATIAARHAMLLEPLNLGVIVTLANFYKAANRYELHDRMLDRYRLLVYMADEGASAEDMLATAAEVEALDRETSEAQDLVQETGREMEEYLFRMEQAMTYSMPIDKEPRRFGKAPIVAVWEQPGILPPEVKAHAFDQQGGFVLAPPQSPQP